MQGATTELDGALGSNQAQEPEAKGRFAGAGLPHHPQGLAGRNIEVEVADCETPMAAAEPALALGVADVEVAKPQQGLGVGLRGHRRARRLRRQQTLGVGMAGLLEDLLASAGLHDLPARHHIDAIGHLPHDAEVMGNQQKPHARLRLQLPQQRQNPGLYGYVQGRGRLIGDQ